MYELCSGFTLLFEFFIKKISRVLVHRTKKRKRSNHSNETNWTNQ